MHGFNKLWGNIYSSTLFTRFSNLLLNVNLKDVLSITKQIIYQHFLPTEGCYSLSLTWHIWLFGQLATKWNHL